MSTVGPPHSVHRLAPKGWNKLADVPPAVCLKRGWPDIALLAAQVKAGEVLCAEGGWPEWFNFVVSGVVVVDQRGRGEVARLTAGSYFGEVAFMKYEHTHTGSTKHASTFFSHSP